MPLALRELAMLSSPLEEGQMVPESTENRLKGAKADYFVSGEDEHAIYTLSHTALVLDTTRERVANIHLVGCVAKNNPRFETIIGQMSELFPGVINSFRFIPEDGISTRTEIP